VDNLTLYSQRSPALTSDQLIELADDAVVSEIEPGRYVIEWADVVIELNELSRGPELEEHLAGFQGFVAHHAGEAVDELQGLIDAIGETEVSIGCVIKPGFDSEQKAKSFLLSMACTYEQCLMFYDSAILSPFGEVWFGPSDMPAFADLADLRVRKLSLHSAAPMTPDQRERHARVRKMLNAYAVPEPAMKRCWVPDAANVTLRTPQDVARRVLAMHGIVCVARGRDRDKTIAELKAAGVRNELTPNEIGFLRQPTVSEEARQAMIWRLEDLWLLMWSLKHVKDFIWPDTMCDVDGLHELIFEKSKDPAEFINKAQLRGKKAILDATQAVIQLQSVVRSAMIDEKEIPGNLNWAKPQNVGPVMSCPGIAVVSQRHNALNWLIRFGDLDWDDVDTPTVPCAVD